MSKYFKTDSVIVRKFNMKDVEQIQLNILSENDLDNTQDEIGEDTTINNKIIKKKNVDKINQNINSKNITKEKSIYKSTEHVRLIVKSAINEYYTDEPTWAVEDKVNKNLVGIIKVTNYSYKNKMCNITWMMSDKYWDNNFMEDALTQIFNFLFLKKNIELIECSYYEQNNSKDIILDEIGMVKEATLRDRRVNEKTNKKENFVIYSINKNEFFENLRKKSVNNRSYKNLKRKI